MGATLGMISIVSATGNRVFESRHENAASRTLRKSALLQNLAFREVVVGTLGLVRMMSTTIIGFSRVATSCILENKQAFLQTLAFHELVGVIRRMNTTEKGFSKEHVAFKALENKTFYYKRRRLESDHEVVPLEVIRTVSAAGNRFSRGVL